MATTAAGTPYVESSDLVANYPGVSLALANHIDTIGKVLQVVRATDSTQRLTTSTTFVDANNSITITPTSTTSNIMLIATGLYGANNATSLQYLGALQISDASNVGISGAQNSFLGATNLSRSGSVALTFIYTLMAWDSPGSISAKTYKLRFRSTNADNLSALENTQSTGQLFAIEVSA